MLLAAESVGREPVAVARVGGGGRGGRKRGDRLSLADFEHLYRVYRCTAIRPYASGCRRDGACQYLPLFPAWDRRGPCNVDLVRRKRLALQMGPWRTAGESIRRGDDVAIGPGVPAREVPVRASIRDVQLPWDLR